MRMAVPMHYFLVRLSVETGYVALDGVDNNKNPSLQHFSLEHRYRREFDS